MAKDIFLESPVYKVSVNKKLKASLESFCRERAEKMKMVYKNYEDWMRMEIDRHFWCLSQYKIIFVSKASFNIATTECNHDVDQLFFNELHAEHITCMSTKCSPPHAHETSCMCLIRQEAIISSIIDLFRPSNQETYEPRVSTSGKFCDKSIMDKNVLDQNMEFNYVMWK